MARGGELIGPRRQRYRHGGMSEDRAYVDQNTRERERLRALVERLDEDELRIPVVEPTQAAVAMAIGRVRLNWSGN